VCTYDSTVKLCQCSPLHILSEMQPISSYGVVAPCCCCVLDVAACDAAVHAITQNVLVSRQFWYHFYYTSGLPQALLVRSRALLMFHTTLFKHAANVIVAVGVVVVGCCCSCCCCTMTPQVQQWPTAFNSYIRSYHQRCASRQAQCCSDQYLALLSGLKSRGRQSCCCRCLQTDST
jgi:hypothetical protein